MKPPTIAWKPFTPRRDVASVRVRCLVPMRLMAEAGLNSELYEHDEAARPDVVVFQKAYESSDLELAERLSKRGTRIVFDLCDNHFYNPDDRPDVMERVDRLRRMIHLADAVTVSSPILADLVEHDRTFLVDDALDPAITQARTRLLPRRSSRSGTHLFWFGNAGSTNPAFGLVDLERIVPALNQIHDSLPIDLTVISNSKEAFQQHVGGKAIFPTRYVRWRLRTFSRFVSGAGISLLPISINPFTSCKTSNRVVTSLMLGAPVIADVIPSYEEFGPYLLFDDWEKNVEIYARSYELRREHVQAGQTFIHKRFAPERLVEQWALVLETVLV